MQEKDDDESQPGTSGSQIDKKKKNQSESRSILTTKKNQKSKEGKKKVKIPAEATHRRKSSAEQTLRYRIPERQQGGPQRSHSVRNLVPQSKPAEKQKAQGNVRINEEASSSSDRDHYDAIDFYNRSTAYGYTRESLVNLRKHANGLRNHHQPAVDQPNLKLHAHVRRCMKCLNVKADCICETMPEKSLMCDWAIMVQSEVPDKRTFTTSSLDWLEKLEEDSKVDIEKLVEDRFNPSREICCFPFFTFNIFSKRDIAEVDFYVKN